MELISFILRANNIDVIPAFDGLTGLASAKQCEYDFILLDIQLPDISGFEVIKRMRAQGVNKPVIAVTSYAMCGDRQLLLASGCDGYIEKPINPELIISQIMQVVKI
ncbi:response regulator receiver [Shewanella denitrificans OS217]|uniref:Response regulator receiver n=2 Tax=Shewanella TaxID=22 RepID=Q12MP6_SHEDO|nr:response regulator receiver [Shewanella denitrificans OS217]